jgi:hypothetical protein
VVKALGDKGPGAHRRLLELVKFAGDQGKAELPEDVQDSIKAFFDAVPEWNPTMVLPAATAVLPAATAVLPAATAVLPAEIAVLPAATTVLPPPPPRWVFFLDEVPGCVVYRAQLSGTGNCSMHAPAVVAHHVVCKYNPRDTSKHGVMVDLTAYILKWFDGERLWRFVYEDIGCDSIWLLKQLTASSNVLELLASATDDAAVVQNLRAYGPSLVASFEMFDGFEGSALAELPAPHSFIGAVSAVPTGLHAMAVVGYRHDAGGGVRLLVQNWWKSKQFFECDLTFLASRRARLAWVSTVLTALPEGRKITNQMYEESYSPGEMSPQERL